MPLDDLFKQSRDRAIEMDNPQLDDWMDEIRGYLDVGKMLGRSIDFEKPATVRRAQRALQHMEARLDRVVALHHDAKRVLQIIVAVEYKLIGAMTRQKMLPKKTTGPAQQQALMTVVPKLITVKTRWETLDQVCTQAQKRIASAKESLKLQSSLDDNLRWAQYRSPA